ncbi:isoform 2 of rho gtpase-activating protein 7, partial [Fagus crenata]
MLSLSHHTLAGVLVIQKQLYNVDELQSDGPSLKECNLGDETGSIGSCTKNNKANPSRFQLEQD